MHIHNKIHHTYIKTLLHVSAPIAPSSGRTFVVYSKLGNNIDCRSEDTLCMSFQGNWCSTSKINQRL